MVVVSIAGDWLLAAVRPEHNVVQQDDWECHGNPERQLGTLPKGRRFQKSQHEYRRIESGLTKAWPIVSAKLSEAARFESEFLAAAGALATS